MKKKAYIAPVTNIFQVHMADGILTTLSGGGLLGSGDDTTEGWTSDTKGSGDWDIWGNGSDSDYDSDY
ncbi:MAG: hypothetical protein E7105_04865 [Prevotella sp.]|nr:hypothetical protein [Prevotella sp.]